MASKNSWYLCDILAEYIFLRYPLQNRKKSDIMKLDRRPILRKRGAENEKSTWNYLQYSCFDFLRPRFCIFVLFWLFLFDADRLDGAIRRRSILFFILCIDGAHATLLHFGYPFVGSQAQKRTVFRLILGAVFPLGNHRSGAYFDVYSYVLKNSIYSII